MSDYPEIIPSENSSDPSTLVDEVKRELDEIDSADLSQHTERFEALHQKLSQALTNIDGL